MGSPGLAMTTEGSTGSTRRQAGVVAAIAGLALAPYFWLSSALVGWPGDETPDLGAPAADYVDFYVDEASRLPLTATLAIGVWVLILVLIVSVVRATGQGGIAAVTSVTLAGASTAVVVTAGGMLAWPTIGFTTTEISDNLDRGVAQALVLSSDGLAAAASVPLGISLLTTSWLLARSDLWGHWLLAAGALLAGVSAVASMVVGPEGLGAGGILLWGVLVAVVVLVGLRRGSLHVDGRT